MSKIQRIRKNLKALEAKGHTVKLVDHQPLATIIHKDNGEVFLVDYETKGVRFPVKILNPKIGRHY